jgi:hypothetical protein
MLIPYFNEELSSLLRYDCEEHVLNVHLLNSITDDQSFEILNHSFHYAYYPGRLQRKTGFASRAGQVRNQGGLGRLSNLCMGP